MATIPGMEAYMADPDILYRLNAAELRALWGQCFPKTPPSPHRCQLTRDLANLAQSRGQRLPRETDALIRAAMKAASVSRSPQNRPAKVRQPHGAEGLPPGAKLHRDWGGRTHEVTVLGGGWFQYECQSYKSLTKVAKVITGAHWSGPWFFGLRHFREKKHG